MCGTIHHNSVSEPGVIYKLAVLVLLQKWKWTSKNEQFPHGRIEKAVRFRPVINHTGLQRGPKKERGRPLTGATLSLMAQKGEQRKKKVAGPNASGKATALLIAPVRLWNTKSRWLEAPSLPRLYTRKTNCLQLSNSN